MRNRMVKSLVVLAAISLLVGSVGCYETLFRLSPIADAKVERELCGDWKLKGTSGTEIMLGVRNLDDHQYSVTWRSSDDPTPLMLVADSTHLGEARFIHARALPEDGTISDTHLILRVDVDGDHMTVRNLNEDFLKTKKVESEEGLRATLEANLDNNDLYDDEVFSGDRNKEEK